MTHDRPIDWPRVSQATFELLQAYTYTYSGPVTDVRQRLVMVPPDTHGDQRLACFEFEILGPRRDEYDLVWETDAFGNRVCRVWVARVEHTLTFRTRYRVERSLGTGGRGMIAMNPHPFSVATALTAPDERIQRVADDIARQAHGPRERAERAHEWASRAIVYQLGVTGVRTPAAMALHLGRGVCQDYAHLLICVLHLLGIPARYVSGQLPGEGVPHAWVEAFVDREVVVYDPTHARRARLDYVTVAVGHDYADVAPTSGTFSGAAAGVLSAAKEARVIRFEYSAASDKEAVA